MTLQEAKDQIARERGYPNYLDFFEDMFEYERKGRIFDLLHEAAELYARSKWDECYEEIQNDILDSSPGSYMPDKPEFKP